MEILPPNHPDRLALTPQEAAAMLGVEVTSIYRLIDRGALPAKRLGKRHIRILKTDFEAFLSADDWATQG